MFNLIAPYKEWSAVRIGDKKILITKLPRRALRPVGVFRLWFEREYRKFEKMA